MYKARSKILILLYLYCVTCLTRCGYAVEHKTSLPNTKFAIALGHDQCSYNIQAATVASIDHNLWIAVSERKMIDTTSERKIVLFEVDDVGRLVREINLTDLGVNGYTVNSMIETSTNNLLALVEQQHLLQISKSGDIIVYRKISREKKLIRFSEIIAVGDDTYLLTGIDSNDAYLMKIDSQGNEIWSKSFERGATHEFFVDGMRVDSNRSILAGVSANVIDSFGVSGASRVWIMCIDDQGNMIGEVFYDGRFPSLCRRASGECSIVYDKGEATTQEIVAVGFSEDLKEQWSTIVFLGENSLTKFEIAPVPNGGFLVAGSEKFTPSIFRIDNKGTVLWYYQEQKNMFNLFKDLINFGNRFYMLSLVPTIENNETRRLFHRVGIIHFIID